MPEADETSLQMAVRHVTEARRVIEQQRKRIAIQLTDEPIDAPSLALSDALNAAGISAKCFLALRPGQVWELNVAAVRNAYAVAPNGKI